MTIYSNMVGLKHYLSSLGTILQSVDALLLMFFFKLLLIVCHQRSDFSLVRILSYKKNPTVRAVICSSASILVAAWSHKGGCLRSHAVQSHPKQFSHVAASSPEQIRLCRY